MQAKPNRGAGLMSVAECRPISALTSETHGIASIRLRATRNDIAASDYASAAFTAALICSSVNGLVSTLEILAFK
jgi:hypothetical protein